MLAFSSGPGGTSKEANRFIAAINTVVSVKRLLKRILSLIIRSTERPILPKRLGISLEVGAIELLEGQREAKDA